MSAYRLLVGDCRAVLPTLPAGSVHCVVTSPPFYGLRDYGVAGQLGLEPTPAEYVDSLLGVFREVWRVLRDDGTVWLNLGDSYAGSWKNQGRNPERGTQRPINGPMIQSFNGHPAPESNAGIVPAGLKPKDLCMIPARVALALQADGWWIRSDVIFSKPNPMPESVTDRPTKAHEYVFLLTKRSTYYYDSEAIAEPSIEPERVRTRGFGGTNWEGRQQHSEGGIWNGHTTRNARTVWEIATQPFSGWTRTSHLVDVEPDDADDDTTRIESPDCPLHGDQAVQAAKVACGERADDASSRIERSNDHPALGLFDAPAPTDQHRGDCSAAESSGLPLHEGVPVDTDRSIESHKTGRVPATILPYTVSAQTSGRTDDNTVLPEISEPSSHNQNNSISPDGSDDPLSAQTTAHIADMISSGALRCTCSYVKKIYKDMSHFATFPEELARRCILAGTSARGCCAECGAPWERVVERVGEIPRRWSGNDTPTQADNWRNDNGRSTQAVNTTTGWRPTCAHNAAVVPCVVLDPFAGSGTVGAVATGNGRAAILIELNPAYCELARQRCGPLLEAPA